MTMIAMMSSAAAMTGKLNSEELKAMEFDDLLDVELSNIEELPDYVTPPKGYYELSLPKVEQRTVETADGDVETLVLTWAVVRTIELEESKEPVTPVEEGALFTTSYMQGAGIQRLVKLFGSVIQQNNCKNIRELLEILPTIHVQASIGHRFAKEDRKAKEKPFADVANVTQA